MAFKPIPLGLTQGNQFSSGRVLKTYLGGTTTATPMYTDSTGGTSSATVLFDADDLPTISSTVIFPHIDTSVGVVKYVLYPNQASADANTGALQTWDNVQTAGVVQGEFDTIAEMTANTTIAIGSYYTCADYATGNNAGIMAFRAVAAGTGTADGGSYIDHDTLSVQFERIFNSVVSVKEFGAVADGATDDILTIQAAIDYVATDGGMVFFPSGVYSTSSAIIPTSGISLRGEGFSTRIECSGTQAVLLSRDAAIDNNTPHSNVVLADMYLESALTAGTPQGTIACVLFEFCDDCLIENVSVGQSDDACIRVSGYRKGIVSQVSSLTNPDFGYAKRNIVRNNLCSGGYIGIELVGGVECAVENNTVLDSAQHGIRLAGGGWNSSISKNKVVTCEHTAIYVSNVKKANISNNPFLNSDRPTTPTALSLYQSEDVIVTNNYFSGAVTDTILSVGGDESSRIELANNITDDIFDFWYTLQISVHDNYIASTARLRTNTTGRMVNNTVGFLTGTAGESISEGGQIYYAGNIDKDTMLPPTTFQEKNLGVASAAPTSGTFTVGDKVYNSAPLAGGSIGWVCVTAGSPGTWKSFGVISA